MRITELLENPLIVKYFGKGECLGEPKVFPFQGDCKHKNCMALRILTGATEPIKKGEDYLDIRNGVIEDKVSNAHDDMDDGSLDGFLKLPDTFQKNLDPVEAKIQELSDMSGWRVTKSELRELIALARSARGA